MIRRKRESFLQHPVLACCKVTSSSTSANHPFGGRRMIVHDNLPETSSRSPTEERDRVEAAESGQSTDNSDGQDEGGMWMESGSIPGVWDSQAQSENGDSSEVDEKTGHDLENFYGNRSPRERGKNGQRSEIKRSEIKRSEIKRSEMKTAERKRSEIKSAEISKCGNRNRSGDLESQHENYPKTDRREFDSDNNSIASELNNTDWSEYSDQELKEVTRGISALRPDNKRSADRSNPPRKPFTRSSKVQELAHSHVAELPSRFESGDSGNQFTLAVRAIQNMQRNAERSFRMMRNGRSASHTAEGRAANHTAEGRAANHTTEGKAANHTTEGKAANLTAEPQPHENSPQSEENLKRSYSSVSTFVWHNTVKVSSIHDVGENVNENSSLKSVSDELDGDDCNGLEKCDKQEKHESRDAHRSKSEPTNKTLAEHVRKYDVNTNAHGDQAPQPTIIASKPTHGSQKFLVRKDKQWNGGDGSDPSYIIHIESQTDQASNTQPNGTSKTPHETRRRRGDIVRMRRMELSNEVSHQSESSQPAIDPVSTPKLNEGGMSFSTDCTTQSTGQSASKYESTPMPSKLSINEAHSRQNKNSSHETEGSSHVRTSSRGNRSHRLIDHLERKECRSDSVMPDRHLSRSPGVRESSESEKTKTTVNDLRKPDHLTDMQVAADALEVRSLCGLKGNKCDRIVWSTKKQTENGNTSQSNVKGKNKEREKDESTSIIHVYSPYEKGKVSRPGSLFYRRSPAQRPAGDNTSDGRGTHSEAGSRQVNTEYESHVVYNGVRCVKDQACQYSPPRACVGAWEEDKGELQCLDCSSDRIGRKDENKHNQQPNSRGLKTSHSNGPNSSHNQQPSSTGLNSSHNQQPNSRGLKTSHNQQPNSTGQNSSHNSEHSKSTGLSSTLNSPKRISVRTKTITNKQCTNTIRTASEERKMCSATQGKPKPYDRASSAESSQQSSQQTPPRALAAQNSAPRRRNTAPKQTVKTATNAPNHTGAVYRARRDPAFYDLQTIEPESPLPSWAAQNYNPNANFGSDRSSPATPLTKRLTTQPYLSDNAPSPSLSDNDIVTLEEARLNENYSNQHSVFSSEAEQDEQVLKIEPMTPPILLKNRPKDEPSPKYSAPMSLDKLQKLIEEAKANSRSNVKILDQNTNFDGEITYTEKEPVDVSNTFIGEYLYKLWKNECLCDVKVSVGEVDFFVHKLVLAAFSNVFCPSTPQPPPSVAFRVPCSTPDAVHQIFNYIYTSSMELRDDLLEPILSAAIFMGISEVVEVINEILMKPTMENLELYICIKRRHGLPSSLVDYPDIYRNFFVELSNHEAFFKMTVNEFEELLKDPEVLVTSELDTISGIANWVKYNAIDRINSLSRLLKYVSFESISPKLLASISEKYNYLFNVPGAPQVISEAFKFHALKLENKCCNPSSSPCKPSKKSSRSHKSKKKFSKKNMYTSPGPCRPGHTNIMYPRPSRCCYTSPCSPSRRFHHISANTCRNSSVCCDPNPVSTTVHRDPNPKSTILHCDPNPISSNLYRDPNPNSTILHREPNPNSVKFDVNPSTYTRSGRHGHALSNQTNSNAVNPELNVMSNNCNVEVKPDVVHHINMKNTPINRSISSLSGGPILPCKRQPSVTTRHPVKDMWHHDTANDDDSRKQWRSSSGSQRPRSRRGKLMNQRNIAGFNNNAADYDLLTQLNPSHLTDNWPIVLDESSCHNDPNYQAICNTSSYQNSNYEVSCDTPSDQDSTCEIPCDTSSYQNPNCAEIRNDSCYQVSNPFSLKSNHVDKYYTIEHKKQDTPAQSTNDTNNTELLKRVVDERETNRSRERTVTNGRVRFAKGASFEAKSSDCEHAPAEWTSEDQKTTDNHAGEIRMQETHSSRKTLNDGHLWHPFPQPTRHKVARDLNKDVFCSNDVPIMQGGEFPSETNMTDRQNWVDNDSSPHAVFGIHGQISPTVSSASGHYVEAGQRFQKFAARDETDDLIAFPKPIALFHENARSRKHVNNVINEKADMKNLNTNNIISSTGPKSSKTEKGMTRHRSGATDKKESSYTEGHSRVTRGLSLLRHDDQTSAFRVYKP